MEKFENNQLLTPLSRALLSVSRLWPRLPVETGPRDAGWLTAAELFSDDEALDSFLEYEGSFTAGLDGKARAAALMAEYSYVFALSTVPPFVGHGIVPDFSTTNYAIHHELLSRRCVQAPGNISPLRIRFLSSAHLVDEKMAQQPLGEAVCVGRTDLRRCFREDVESHFRPLVERLHAKTGLASNALWRLVGDAIGALFLDAGQKFGRKAEAIAEAMEILKAPGSPLKNRQMHFFEVELYEEANPERLLLSRTFRARGGCCRYYTAPEGKLCSTCVMLAPEERVARIRDGMRRRLSSPSGNARSSLQTHQV